MKPSLALLVSAAALLVACATPASTAFSDGVRFYRAGDYASARDAFDNALRRDSTVAASWNNRGVATARLGDLPNAVLDLTRAAQLAPADAEILFNRANAYAAAGHPAAAINDYTTAVALRPGYSEAYFNRGTVRATTGDYVGAVADWQWAIDVEPDPWARAAMRRGSSLDYLAALPRQSAVTVVNDPAPVAAPVPTSGALSPQALDVRALVARAMSREVEGDRPGALADLRAAVGLESDAARRARIDRLLRVLEASR
jgi:tetratricopeptide (TPR) repeat protein